MPDNVSPWELEQSCKICKHCTYTPRLQQSNDLEVYGSRQRKTCNMSNKKLSIVGHIYPFLPAPTVSLEANKTHQIQKGVITADVRNFTASAMLVYAFWAGSSAEEYRVFFRPDAEGLELGGQSLSSNSASWHISEQFEKTRCCEETTSNEYYHKN